MIFHPDDRVLIKPLGVHGTVVRAAAQAVARWVVRADCSTQDVVWSEHELEKVVGRSAEHTIQDPDTGEISGRMIF